MALLGNIALPKRLNHTILLLSSSGFWGKTKLVASRQRLPCAEIDRWTLGESSEDGDNIDFIARGLRCAHPPNGKSKTRAASATIPSDMPLAI
jgi:hypothetical protein